MNLVCRSLEEADIAPCLAFVAGDYAENPGVFPDAPAVWRQLLAAERARGMVLEDVADPNGPRCASFGLSVFVTPDYLAQARHSARPGQAAALAACVRDGGDPVLTTDAARRANAGPGLNLLVLHFWETQAADTPEDLQTIRDKQVETFFFVHGGYRLDGFLLEHRDPRLVRFARDGGAAVRSEYDAYYQSHPPRSSEGRAILLGFSRAEALTHPGLHIATVFQYTPPRLGFKPREQALLRRALLDETDTEIAQALEITVAAVKKRWAGIYERVADHDPAWFPRAEEEAGDRQGRDTRGQEKRRRLLRYLRGHPEELRPV